MLKKIKDVFKKETPETKEIAETKTIVIPKSQYSFVEQYVIMDPHNIMANYEAWSFCEFTRVAYESDEATGFLSSVELPTKWAQKFLREFKNCDAEFRKDPRHRLISVIHLADNDKLYVIPCLESKTGSQIVGEHCNDETRKNDWMFYVTPEINRAIVEQAKIRSRR